MSLLTLTMLRAQACKQVRCDRDQAGSTAWFAGFPRLFSIPLDGAEDNIGINMSRHLGIIWNKNHYELQALSNHQI